MGTDTFLSLIMSGDNNGSNFRNISSIIYSYVLHITQAACISNMKEQNIIAYYNLFYQEKCFSIYDDKRA